MPEVQLVGGSLVHLRIRGDAAKQARLLGWIAEHGVAPDDVQSLRIVDDEVTFAVFDRDDDGRIIAVDQAPKVTDVTRPVASPWPFEPWQDYLDA